jgi:hypothetical protein
MSGETRPTGAFYTDTKVRQKYTVIIITNVKRSVWHNVGWWWANVNAEKEQYSKCNRSQG